MSCRLYCITFTTQSKNWSAQHLWIELHPLWFLCRSHRPLNDICVNEKLLAWLATVAPGLFTYGNVNKCFQNILCNPNYLDRKNNCPERYVNLCFRLPASSHWSQTSDWYCITYVILYFYCFQGRKSLLFGCWIFISFETVFWYKFKSGW